MPANKPYRATFFTDHVGRPRKLSHGAILDIQRRFRHGELTATLATQYGVSTSLIRTICYNTPREKDLRREQRNP